MGCGPDRAVSEAFNFVSTWSTSMRYDPAEGDLREAEEFLRHVETVLAWGDNKI